MRKIVAAFFILFVPLIAFAVEDDYVRSQCGDPSQIVPTTCFRIASFSRYVVCSTEAEKNLTNLEPPDCISTMATSTAPIYLYARSSLPKTCRLQKFEDYYATWLEGLLDLRPREKETLENFRARVEKQQQRLFEKNRIFEKAECE